MSQFIWKDKTFLDKIIDEHIINNYDALLENNYLDQYNLPAVLKSKDNVLVYDNKLVHINNLYWNSVLTIGRHLFRVQTSNDRIREGNVIYSRMVRKKLKILYNLRLNQRYKEMKKLHHHRHKL